MRQGFLSFLDKKDETLWCLLSNLLVANLGGLPQSNTKIYEIFAQKCPETGLSLFDSIFKEALAFINSEHLTKTIVKQS